jgi:hypothetical protein|nr:MAG TPA: hypothetical protein [Caudoviricetes sp.]
MYKIVTDIDEETVFRLCSKLSISIDEIDITKIRWKAEDTYIKDDILHIPIKAVGYKVILKKNPIVRCGISASFGTITINTFSIWFALWSSLLWFSVT